MTLEKIGNLSQFAQTAVENAAPKIAQEVNQEINFKEIGSNLKIDPSTIEDLQGKIGQYIQELGQEFTWSERETLESVIILNDPEVLSEDDMKTWNEGEKHINNNIEAKKDAEGNLSFEVIIDGETKTFTSMEEAHTAAKEEYAKHHPEYAAADSEVQKAKEEHQSFMDEQRQLYLDNGGDPEQIDEYMDAMEEFYTNNNPNYAMYKEHAPESLLNGILGKLGKKEEPDKLEPTLISEDVEISKE